MSAIPEVKLDELYQEVILDHNKKPRNYGELKDATHSSHGLNPLCGDDYYLYLKVNGDQTVEEVMFTGQGCAISKSSASILTTLAKGKAVQTIMNLKDSFINLLTKDVADDQKKDLGKLLMYEGVKQYPIRIKCATLIWHALDDALKSTS